MAGSVAPELRERLHHFLQAVRLFKSQQTPVPPGLVSVLGAIDRIGDERAVAGCHLKDLAARNALDPSTVSRAVTTLVQHGLVRRTADPADGRASILRLTERGEVALSDTHRRYDAVLAEALADWSPEDLATFCTLLRRFADDLLNTSPHTTLEAAR
jgi:DNA-binding MarR family transcriptional regulator